MRNSKSSTRLPGNITGASTGRRKFRTAAITSALLLGVSLTGGGFVSNALGLRAASATEMFPSNTTDFVSLDMRSAAGANASPELLDTVKGLSADTAGGWKFLTDLSSEATVFIDNRAALPWLGFETAKGTWGDHKTPATMYQVLNSGDAQKYMESDACDTGFLKSSCHGKYIISSGWLITGEPDVLADYPEKPKNSLAKNETFINDFAAAPSKPLLKVWAPAKEISDTLPADFKETGSQDGRVSASMSLSETGFSLKMDLHDSTNPYYVDLQNRGTVSGSIGKLPANSVVAIAGAGVSSSVGTMLSEKDSFINTHKEWTDLKNAMAKWKVSLPGDLPKIFGTDTAFSINEGNSGNLVSGVMRVQSADENKVISLFSEAAKSNKDIINTYKIRKEGDDIVIESHDPKTDGSLSGSDKFNALVGDTSKSVAAAYVDLDKAHSLLDSTYKVPEKGYEKGILGINITAPAQSVVSITLNWTAR